MKKKKGQCDVCVTEGDSQDKWLARNKPPTCTYHYQREQQEKAFNRQKEKPISRSSIKKKPRPPTGEKEVFLQIWNERPHVCEHCGRPLGEEMKVHFFDHKKGKGAHGELRLDKNNIWLLCWYWEKGKGWTGCHHIKTTQGKKAFDSRKDSFIKTI